MHVAKEQQLVRPNSSVGSALSSCNAPNNPFSPGARTGSPVIDSYLYELTFSSVALTISTFPWQHGVRYGQVLHLRQGSSRPIGEKAFQRWLQTGRGLQLAHGTARDAWANGDEERQLMRRKVVRDFGGTRCFGQRLGAREQVQSRFRFVCC